MLFSISACRHNISTVFVSIIQQEATRFFTIVQNTMSTTTPNIIYRYERAAKIEFVNLELLGRSFIIHMSGFKVRIFFPAHIEIIIRFHESRIIIEYGTPNRDVKDRKKTGHVHCRI